MGILDIMNRVVGIMTGVINAILGAVALTEKYQSYIKRSKEETAKDPSACLPATDGSSGDRDSDL